jgi:hypothetical protein
LKGSQLKRWLKATAARSTSRSPRAAAANRHIGRRADVLVALMRHERLDVGARGDVEAAARLERVAAVVLARVPGEKGAAAAGAEFQGRRYQSVAARRLERTPSAASPWRTGLLKTLWVARPEISASGKELRRAPIAQRFGFDAEHIGIIAGGRQLDGRDILLRARLGTQDGNPV